MNWITLHARGSTGERSLPAGDLEFMTHAAPCPSSCLNRSDRRDPPPEGLHEYE